MHGVADLSVSFRGGLDTPSRRHGKGPFGPTQKVGKQYDSASLEFHVNFGFRGEGVMNQEPITLLWIAQAEREDSFPFSLACHERKVMSQNQWFVNLDSNWG